MHTLDICASTATRGGRMAAGIVIREADGQTVRVVARSLKPMSQEEAAYRAVLYGLWRAKGLGARRILVRTDNSQVVAQLEGQADVPSSLIGLYLQTKAMLNAYRWSSVEWVERDRNAEAALAAMEALDREPELDEIGPEDMATLPLWSSAEQMAAGAGSAR